MDILQILSSVTDSLQNMDPLRQIENYTSITAKNTTFDFHRSPDFWELFAVGISLIALAVSVLATWFQKQTESNTRLAITLKHEAYEYALLRMMKHIFLNYCQIAAISCKLKKEGFALYPNESHFNRFVIRTDDSNIDSFLFPYERRNKDKAVEDYLRLTELYDMIQNYNEDVRLTIEYLKDAQCGADVKGHNLHNLSSKISNITLRCFRYAYEIYGPKTIVNPKVMCEWICEYRERMDKYYIYDSYLDEDAFIAEELESFVSKYISNIPDLQYDKKVVGVSCDDMKAAIKVQFVTIAKCMMGKHRSTQIDFLHYNRLPA